MTSLQSDVITSPPKAPSLRRPSHRSDSNYKPAFLSFQNLTPTCPRIFSSLSSNAHFSLLDGSVDSNVYASVLDSCTSIVTGKLIHAHLVKSGFHEHEFVGTKLLQMYSRCCCLDDAGLLFAKMPKRTLYSWVAILRVHVDCDLFEEAFYFFEELLIMDIRFDFFVFPIVLKICSGLKEIEIGRQVHGLVIKLQLTENIYVGNSLIDMYGKCRSLDDAKKVFTIMPKKDCVSWNSLVSACAFNGMAYEALQTLGEMSKSEDSAPNIISWSAVINGFAQNGYSKEAVDMLSRIQAEGFEPNAQTLASVLTACAGLQSLSLGKQIHAYITRHEFICNPIIVNGLLDVYRKSADMRSAGIVFSKFSVKNQVSFNTMIAGYFENGYISNAEQLFDQMETNGMEKNVITWNVMISGYVDNHCFEEALSFFRELQMVDVESNSYTLGSALSACAAIGSLSRGKEIHSQAVLKGLHSDRFVGEALVEMYCKCQELTAAGLAFLAIIDKDTQSWNQIIAGHVQNGHFETALQLFSDMKTAKTTPDIHTIGIILTACSRLATIKRGKQVHAHSIRCGYDSDVYVGAALVDMYAKCGCIELAEMANRWITKPNIVSQNAMLTAYGMHGRGQCGIALFHEMLADGFFPDEVTFLSALSSCVHVGEVEMGYEIFSLMGDFNVEPSLKHYTTIVNLLSRSGRTVEAYEIIKKMPMEPDSITWSALLGGCVNNGDEVIGEIAGRKLIELEPNNTGNFIILANLYAYAGRWDDLARVRQMIKEQRMHKRPGCSWIEDGNDVHVFVTVDSSHKRKDEIYATVYSLDIHMKTLLSSYSLDVAQ